VQIEWADYVQNAQIGLLEAMSRFNETRGTDFIAYAKPRVRGSVFNGVRTILREESQRRSLLGERVERLQSIGSESSSDPLNDFISTVVGLSLGHMLETEQFGHISKDALALAEHHELGMALRDSLLELGKRERAILLAHYFRHVSFQEIAKLQGVTKGRISQIHKGALVRLRVILAERRNDFLSL
jgi:RNA polymerase sigma factor for flagellar operon FliA